MQPCGAEKIHYFWTCNPAAQKKSIIFGLATLQRRKNPLFLDMQPCGAEKIHFFLTRDPAAQKKSIIFGLATLRRRKNPLFFDMQPCGAEKTRCFLTKGGCMRWLKPTYRIWNKVEPRGQTTSLLRRQMCRCLLIEKGARTSFERLSWFTTGLVSAFIGKRW